VADRTDTADLLRRMPDARKSDLNKGDVCARNPTPLLRPLALLQPTLTRVHVRVTSVRAPLTLFLVDPI
jgi:hypothetical protein